MVRITRLLSVDTRAKWRAWLAGHHKSEREIWLVFYKKQTGKPRLSYNDAVEEALCFGWIDSLVKRIDDERFAQRFSPRKSTSSWSAENIKRVRKLIQLGKMTPAGLAVAKTAISLPKQN